MNHNLFAGRNLQIGRHPILNRPYPALLHHWTEAEFERFLDEQRFPRNSNRDHLAWRRHCVIEALAMGEPVPQEVLDEQPDLIVESHARHQSDEAVGSLNVQIAAARDAFEFLIGYSVSADSYRSSLASLLAEAVVTHAAPLHKPFYWRSTQVSIAVDHGRAPRWGQFGLLDSGRPKTLQIRPNSNSVWALHTVKWQQVEAAVEEMLHAGAITLEQVWPLCGTGWIPDSLRYGGVSTSASASPEAAQA